MQELTPTGSVIIDEDVDDNNLFVDRSFLEPQKMLDSRMSKIQMPVGKVMNKVPEGVLQKIFKANKEYLPVAVSK